ncbi:MAG: phosphoribosylglycinamide formyltransferase [Bacteroidales bacterium]|nr:phosphoribosylglycinamide formyltransferase [Bacteroidales bacterium]
MINIAILASGNGTNAQQISEYFAGSDKVCVKCIIYNRKDAYVAERAKNLGIPAHYFSRKDFYENGSVMQYLKEQQIDWVILAGFLWLVPDDMLAAYPDHIINIHPALLPNYGGKGMYGHHVHEAVIANHEKESGITIHIVDNRYDCGTTLFQAKCTLTDEDTPDTLAEKIHLLEKAYFPMVIEKTVLG